MLPWGLEGYIYKEIIDIIPPFLFGGDMIEYVGMDSTTYRDNFEKFEGGTPNVEGVGCATSTASMLFDVIIGKLVEDGERVVENFLKMIKKEDIPEEDKEELEDAGLLGNIFNMPGCVKCAILAWNGVKVIFERI